MKVSNNNINDLSVKQRLVEVTDAVRKKFNTIKHRHMENKLTLEKNYEPITKPLKSMSSATEVKPGTQSIPLSMRLPIQKTPTTDYQIDSTPGRNKDSNYEENNASQISFMNTPPSSSFITTPESDTSFIHSSAIQINDIVRNHIKKLKSNNSAYDVVYGVRVHLRAKKLLMGDVEIRFPDENIELWNGKRKLATYNGSPALYDVIFLKRPPILNSNDDGNIMENFDSKTYGEILRKTKAPYKNYDTGKGLNFSNSQKYRKIIGPLMSYQILTRSHFGEGFTPKIPTVKLYKHGTVDYIYWNKPKELVNRLRLLWSSKMAGHTGHDNEILSIIEELREEGIVY